MSRHTAQARPQPQSYQTHRPGVSSRSAYPSFLSVQNTAQIQLTCAWRGFVEAFRWDLVISTVSGDSEIRANLLKSLMLNTLSLASIYTFDLLLRPLVKDEQKWLHRNVGWFYQVLWLLPVVGASLHFNSLWCTLIAKRTFILQHGSRASHQPPTTYTGMLTVLATSAYRVVMICTSVIISFALSWIPVIGPFAGFCFMCWVDAYYCFEFIWIARGMSLSRRVRFLEERWAYYFAFGVPVTVLCVWGNTLANAALFALVFPAYIIMAMHAHPLPLDPYSPGISAVKSASEHTMVHPSPFIPIRLHIFAIVIWLNDWIVRIISVGGGNRKSRATGGRSRVMSDGIEKAEEGIELEVANFGTGQGFRPGTSRRKLD